MIVITELRCQKETTRLSKVGDFITTPKCLNYLKILQITSDYHDYEYDHTLRESIEEILIYKKIFHEAKEKCCNYVLGARLY